MRGDGEVEGALRVRSRGWRVVVVRGGGVAVGTLNEEIGNLGYYKKNENDASGFRSLA